MRAALLTAWISLRMMHPGRGMLPLLLLLLRCPPVASRSDNALPCLAVLQCTVRRGEQTTAASASCSQTWKRACPATEDGLRPADNILCALRPLHEGLHMCGELLDTYFSVQSKRREK